MSVDPLAGYNPIGEVEHYIDGQHNGGVFNDKNLNVYGYTYQNPVLYIDPNGKQSEFHVMYRDHAIHAAHAKLDPVIVDNSRQAVLHYYNFLGRDRGRSVEFGSQTKQILRDSPRTKYIEQRIIRGVIQDLMEKKAIKEGVPVEEIKQLLSPIVPVEGLRRTKQTE